MQIRIKRSLAGPSVMWRVGDILEVGIDLPGPAARRLLEAGHAEPLGKPEPETAAKATGSAAGRAAPKHVGGGMYELPDGKWAKHVGGGMYELPDGSRVKGKKAALAKLAELEG